MNIYSEKRGGAVYRQGDTHEGDTGLRNWCKTEITIFEFFFRENLRGSEVELAIGEDGRGDQDPDVKPDAQPRRHNLDPYWGVASNCQCTV